ncbi:MerR family transcriptional regulator [Acetobacteraceae bacterium B3987]|nr:MerR family transcriptional regulator [Acetobacteraceae bacterium B3987]
MTSTDSYQHGGLRTAASVAEELGLPLYRLRSWESLYPVFKTEQRADGQSYYDEQAVMIVRNIARLLYQDGARSHEVVPQLKREGIIGDDSVSPSHGSEGATSKDVAPPSDRLKELQQENRTLNERLEEFGRIALSLKTLEDENASLKEALQQAHETPPQKEDEKVYLAELEEQHLLLQEAVERLTAEKEAHQQVERDEAQALREELKAVQASVQRLESENEALRAAGQKQREVERDEAQALREELKAVQASAQRLESENEALRAAGQKQREVEAARSRTLEERNHELQRTIEQLKSEAKEHQREAESRKERLTQLEGLRVKLADMQAEHGRLQELTSELEEVRTEAERCHALETENETLRAASAKQSEAAQAEYQELEKETLSLRETVERLTAEIEKQLQSAEVKQGEFDALHKRFATLQAEHEQLHSSQKEDSFQHKQLSNQLETLSAERQELVRKLEQSVLIMQSLEDENVRLKRSLKEGEEKRAAQAVIVKKVEHLETENDGLRREQASFAEERERHVESLERIRALEGEGVVLQQRLAAQEMDRRLQAKRKSDLDELLRDLLGELAEMKKTLLSEKC